MANGDMINANGSQFVIDEERFGRIQAGRHGFACMEGLPRLAGLWNTPICGAQCAASTLTGPPALPTQVSLWPSGGFPITTNTQPVEEKIAAYGTHMWTSGMFDTEFVNSDEFGDFTSGLNALLDLFGSPLQMTRAQGAALVFLFSLLSFLTGGCQGWDDLEAEHRQNTPRHLSIISSAILHIRWVAISVGVDLAGWYPWSPVDEPAAMNSLIRVPYIHDHDDPIERAPRYGPTHESALACRREYLGGQLIGYRFHPLLLSPAVAASFARFELTGSNSPASQWEAIERLVEWFHGPGFAEVGIAAYQTIGDPLASAFWMNQNWTGVNPYACGGMMDLATVPLWGGAFPVTSVLVDGMQGWIHPPWAQLTFNGGCSTYALGDWWEESMGALMAPSAPAGINVTDGPSYGRSRYLKMGGCGPAAHFFQATTLAMNIPSQTTPIMIGDYNVHVGLRLPTMALGLTHADQLWGPGASLFGADRLFDSDAVVLATAFAQGIFMGQPEWMDPALRANLNATLAFTAELTHYYVCRNYFSAMLDGYQDPTYRQQLLDSIVFQSNAAYGGMAFGALHEWMFDCVNPLHPNQTPVLQNNILGQFGACTNGDLALATLIAPRVHLPTWPADPPDFPRRVWHEAEIQAKCILGYDSYNLKHLYTLPVDLEDEALGLSLVELLGL